MSVIKRFVAGAVCPRCGKMDTIRTYRNEIREYRECVHCEYTDGQNLDGTPDEPAAELATRVNQPRVEPKPTSQALKFVPNPGSKRRDH